MDSQDNIVLKTIRGKSTKEFFIKISDSITKKLLFSIFEFEDAIIKNNSQNHIIFIENIEEGGEIKLLYGEEVQINYNDHPFPTMEYRIRIHNIVTNKSNLYLYRIAHLSSTTDAQYKTMVTSIGQYDENLLYEQDAKYLSGKRIYCSGYRSLQTMIAILIDNHSLINNSLNSILINPLLKDKRIVNKSLILEKQSSRSIIKNEKSAKPNTYYSTRIVQHSDFELNRYLIYMLIFSKLKLEDLKNNCERNIKKNKKKLENILKMASADSANRKNHTKYQIEMLDKRTKQLNTFLKYYNVFLFNINKILTSQTFANIEPSSKRDNSIVFYPQYLNIERQLYLPLFQSSAFSFSNTYGSILSSPIKQTSKLFEAYCLLSLDAAIIELGFTNNTEEIDYEHIVKKFVRDEYEIELMYEINAKDVSVANKDDIYYINRDTNHISPDFFLVLKKEKFPICFMIFDAKCRKVESVNKDIIEGKYEDTIRNYLSLRYATDDNLFFSPKTVNSLWLLLPEDNSCINYPQIHKLEYRFEKLLMDGNEERFISKLEGYLSLYLD